MFDRAQMACRGVDDQSGVGNAVGGVAEGGLVVELVAFACDDQRGGRDVGQAVGEVESAPGARLTAYTRKFPANGAIVLISLDRSQPLGLAWSGVNHRRNTSGGPDPNAR